jgi:general L-amino acid transport system permease protein
MAGAGVHALPAARQRVAPWRDERVRSIVFQIATVAIVLAFGAYLAGNAIENLHRQGIATGFGFLGREASFAINPTLIPFSPADSYARALLVGLLNTLLVAGLGIVFATVLGFVVGIARLSSNWLVSRLALAYVEALRNTPLLLQIFVWWDVLRFSAPQPREAWEPLAGVYVSNRGVVFPVPIYDPLYLWMLAAAAAGLAFALVLRRWARRRLALTGQILPTGWLSLAFIILPPVVVFVAGGAPYLLDVPKVTRFDFSGGQSITPEFAALLFALTAYTAAFIGEIVRGGIQSVSRGQSEAALALGLTRGLTLRLVVLPQAIRVIIPPTTSEYLNLTKNSSLAVAIGFSELFAVSNTTANQTGQAIEVMAIVSATYLALSLTISLLMNIYNRWAALVER